MSRSEIVYQRKLAKGEDGEEQEDFEYDQEDDDEDEQDMDIDEQDRIVLNQYLQSQSKRVKINVDSSSSHEQGIQPEQKFNKKSLNKIDNDLNCQMSNSAKGSFLSSLQKIDSMYNSIKKDKNDRATVEQVLDPLTLIILHKLIQNSKIDKLYGCISTGKEANVYLTEGRCKDFNTLEMIPEGEPNMEFAVKIFKTSILVFKDRERYVEGEFRFRRGHCKGNPRKKVKLWAEKEVRNLKRICMSGKIRAPVPYYLKNNVIVMEFIGEKGIAAPRLKDAIIGQDDKLEIAHLYEECLLMMRNLYQDCKLIHGDLSEYNLLYHKGEIWMIDVSQSVEYDHPMALDFLRRDCAVMNDFFSKNQVFILTTIKLFNFITDVNIPKSKVDSVLSSLLKDAQNGYTQKEMDDDKVFEQIYIPRTLQELHEVDVENQFNFGHKDFYKNLSELRINDAGTGTANQDQKTQNLLNSDGNELAEYQNKQVLKILLEKNSINLQEQDVEEGKDQQSGEEDSNDSDDNSNESSDEDDQVYRNKKKKKDNLDPELGMDYDSDDMDKQQTVSLAGMTKEQKKAHKAKVKEDNREKRKNKLNKYDKKKAMNKGKFNKNKM